MTERDQELAEMMQLDQQRRGTGDKHRDSIHIADLSPDAQEVLRRVIEKFRVGVKEHGPLNVTSKRWGPELLNEAIDALHYCIFELMRLEVAYSRMVTCSHCGWARAAETETATVTDDGLPLGGEWEAPNVSE